MTYLVGLTGGLASGKSQVSQQLQALGVWVLDADDLVHEAMAPSGALEGPILQAFSQLSAPIDRRVLARHVFSDPLALKRLEGLVHPYVRQALKERTQALKSSVSYGVWIVPLLFEAGLDQDVDRVGVVHASEAIRRLRAKARDGRSDQELEAIFKAQWSDAQRLSQADDILMNEGSVEGLKSAVECLHRHWLMRSSLKKK